MSLGLGLFIISGCLAVLAGWSVNFRITGARFSWIGFLIGALAFLMAGVVQNLLVTPVALAIHGGEGVVQLVPMFFWEAVYYGLAAGVAQEGMKCLANAVYRRRAFLPVAIALGAGFAWAEIVLISFPAWQTPVASLAGLALPVWERFSAILFHIGTAMLIGLGFYRQMVWRYLLLAVMLHTVVDAVVGLMALFKVDEVIVFELAFFVFSLMTIWLASKWTKQHWTTHDIESREEM